LLFSRLQPPPRRSNLFLQNADAPVGQPATPSLSGQLLLEPGRQRPCICRDLLSALFGLLGRSQAPAGGALVLLLAVRSPVGRGGLPQAGELGLPRLGDLAQPAPELRTPLHPPPHRREGGRREPGEVHERAQRPRGRIL